MSIHSRDNMTLTARITARLEAARAQVARLRPEDRELRGRLREQLDDMLTELRAPAFATGRLAENTGSRSGVPAARPMLALQASGK